MSKSQVTEALQQAAPPAAITGLSFAGIPLNEWVYILTIIYTLIMGARLMWKWYHEIKEKHRESP